MDTVGLINTLRADRAGIHDDLADHPEAWRELRDAVRVLAADRTADPRRDRARDVGAAVATLNTTAALAPGWPSLVDGRTEWTTHVNGEARTLGEAAGEAVRFFASDVELLACLAPGCVRYFVKDHPRRAWCSTACGNRERAARHYARHRPSTSS